MRSNSVDLLKGILFFGEPANLLRMAGIAVVLGGGVMLRLAEGYDISGGETWRLAAVTARRYDDPA